ncbi:hypothetical protein Tco_0546152 [Tanacetum coccineum]
MVEPEPVKPIKKKVQIMLDEEIALKLQAEIDEEERIARAKEEKIDEANIAWDDIQAKVDADYQLAERLQAEEQEQFTIEEKATLQKVDEDKDTTELQSLMEVIPDEEEVAIDVVPLATKIFSQMIKSFDMEDLEDLYKFKMQDMDQQDMKEENHYTKDELGRES